MTSKLNRRLFLSASAFSLAQLSSPALSQTTLGPKTTGVPGPGADNRGVVEFDKTSIGGEETFETFGCNVYKYNAPTPDWKPATVYFERDFFNEKLELPDGNDVEYWGFEDPLLGKGKRTFPSPLIRVQEGDLVHVQMKAGKGPHTIHHHGIEPTTMNDGVGHVSMEVSGRYTYQWQPRFSGSWFYHCHVNTVLHFQYGLYGALVVDPPPDAEGKVRAYRGGPNYDVERIWVFDSWDPRWHELEHGAGLCGEDVGLNRFEPRYFFVTGIANTRIRPASSVAVQADASQQILVRMINAHYGITRVQFDFPVTIIAVDGHPLDKPWSNFIDVPAGQWIEMATAARYDVLVRKGNARTGAARIQYANWVSRRIFGDGERNPLYVGYAEVPFTVA
jgi:hypothetical protein